MDMTINRLQKQQIMYHCMLSQTNGDLYLECFAGSSRSIINIQHFIYIPEHNSLPEVSLSVFLATWRGTGDV
jgi:hypothetical protein